MVIHGAAKPIPEPISFSEINAYSLVMACPLGPWEVEIIRRLDGLVRADEFHPIEFEPPGSVKAIMQRIKERAVAAPGENIG
jgi:hypothetical protein